MAPLPLLADQLTIKFNENGIWIGELNDKIIVCTKKNGAIKEYSGTITRAGKSFIIVEEELIFLDDIDSIKHIDKPLPVLNLWVLDNKLVNESGDPIEVDSLFATNEIIMVHLHKCKAIKENTQPEKEIEVNPIVENETSKTIVIPLNGRVGAIHGLDSIGEEGWFNGPIIEELLEDAAKDRDNVERVIFEIDSGGGYVIDRDYICDLIDVYRGRFEFIAFPHDAFSAASTIVMTCDQLWIASDTSLGAAVVVSGGTAVDKKEASADSTIVKNYFLKGQKPVCIADAFSKVESELWFNTVTKEFASSGDVSQSDWTQLDSSESVFTFDHDTLHFCGLADRKIESLHNFYEKDIFENWGSKMDRELKKAATIAKSLDKNMQKYWDMYNEIRILSIDLDYSYIDNAPLTDEYQNVYKSFRSAVFNARKAAKEIKLNLERGKYPFLLSTRQLEMLSSILRYGDLILDAPKENYWRIARYVSELHQSTFPDSE